MDEMTDRITKLIETLSRKCEEMNVLAHPFLPCKKLIDIRETSCLFDEQKLVFMEVLMITEKVEELSSKRESFGFKICKM